MVSLNYFGNFEWQKPLPFQGLVHNNVSAQLDKNGVFYATGRAFDRTGATVWDSILETVIADGIDALYGFAIVDRTNFFEPGYVQATPIIGGNYLLSHIQTGHGTTLFDKWWVIIAVPAVGSLNSLQVIGALRYRTLLGAPYTLYGSAMIMNNQTVSDPILLHGNGNFAAENHLFVLLPSVSDFIGGTYNGGYGGAFTDPGEIPYITYLPVGVAGGDFSSFLTNATFDSNNNQANFSGFGNIFALPGPGSSTNIYQYLNRGRMEFEVIAHPFNQNCPEIKNVIAPAHPLGTMIKFNIPNTDYASTAATAVSGPQDNQHGYHVSDLLYTIDGDAWGMPFLDEYTYISTGSAGGHDAYQPSRAINLQLPSGEWFVAFIMPGIDDAKTNLILVFPFGPPVILQQMKAIRGYIYDPVAGSPATVFSRVTGTAYTRDQLFPPESPTWFQILDPVQTGPDSYSVHICGSFASEVTPVWRTQLFNLFRAGITIKPWVWVNS